MSPDLNQQIIRFSLVGVINTVLDFCIFVMLYRVGGLDPLLANTIAFSVAVTNSYLLNQRWTFHSPDHGLSLAAYGRFVVLNTGGLLIGTLAILLLGRFMPLEFAKIIAAGLTLLWNFTSSKLFVFNTRNP